ncbi:MAG: hypothetical protein ABSH12_00240 [Endomicrobiales bacterium]
MIIPGRYKITICFLAVCVIISCATNSAYYNNLNGLTSQGRYLDAASLIEQSKHDVYGEKNALLFYLDKALLLHLGGNYTGSNDCFERAKKLSDQYFTKSVTTEASTLLINDTMRPYYGEDFERALINVFCALNYIMIGSPMEALVEARQVDQFLTTLQVNYGYKNKYKEDAFARYLMGMIYENQNQINDAFISYRQALDAYSAGIKAYGLPVPRALISDALRMAQQLGFSDEIRDITRTWGIPVGKPLAESDGELIILDYNGFSAEKVETVFEIAFGRAWAYVGAMTVKGDEQSQVDQAGAIARSILSDEQVRMAFPKYTRVPYRIMRFSATADDSQSTSEVVDDISAIAERSLDDRITRIRIRTIARAAIKFALAHKISQKVEEQSGNAALGWLTKKALSVASTATEHADLRSWRSLPDRILMARMPLFAGTHTVVVKFYDSHGAEIQNEILNNVVIKPGKKTFAIVRTAR